MLNPILFTERVVQDFLRYQLTAYPFADKSLYAQMRQLLNLEETRRSPLLKGPYVSLSRTFEEGIAVADAVGERAKVGAGVLFISAVAVDAEAVDAEAARARGARHTLLVLVHRVSRHVRSFEVNAPRRFDTY